MDAYTGIYPLWNQTDLNLFRNETFEAEDAYDYEGALLFVLGLLSIYGITILFLFISLIRKSRSEMEIVDNFRDFEAWQRANQKKSMKHKSQAPSPESPPESYTILPAVHVTRKASVSFGLNFVNPNSGIGTGQIFSEEMV